MWFYLCEIRGYIEGIMAQLYTKVKLYLEANGKTEDEFDTPLSSGNVVLRNEGSSPSDTFIDKWEVSGLAQPTEEQLNSYSAQADIEEANIGVRHTRKKAYGDIGDQLDEIFKDIDAWKARIQAIKDANAKE
jgi:hypothetical protein